MYAIQQLLTKAQNTVSTYIQGNFKFSWYITRENVLVRYDSHLLKAQPFSLQQFFLFPILLSVIFAKSFALKRVMCFSNSMQRNLFCKHLHFPAVFRLHNQIKITSSSLFLSFVKLSYSFYGMKFFITLSFVESFLFLIISEELDSYIALNYFSMDFSLVTPTTIRVTNFLIIKVFNLQ